jgi:cytochrome c
MSSLEFNKIAGAVLGTLTLTVGLGIFAEILFERPEPAKAGYELSGDAPAADAGSAKADPPLASLTAKASVEKGEALFGKCKGCHNVQKDGPNGNGPNLYGVIGGPKAHKDNFNYTEGFKARHDKGETWTPEDFYTYIKDPKAFVPGTKMTFAGLDRPEDRVNILAYLNSKSDKPVDLPKS